jgi:hypothetical protein
MKKSLILLLSLFLLSSCGGDNSSESPGVGTIVDDSLLEVGDNPLDEENEFTVTNACDVFNDTRHGLGAIYQDMFDVKFNRCDRLGQRQANSFMQSSAFANVLFSQLNSTTPSEVCTKLAKRAIRKVKNLSIRDSKIADNHEKSALYILRNEITNQRLSKILRKLYFRGCVNSAIENITYEFNNETVSVDVLDTHLVNGSFELFKNVNDDQRGTSYLQDGWTIVDSSNVPGWRVQEVYDSGETKNCSYLEVQASGVVTSAPSGNQIVELDSHCKNQNGNNVGGDANVEIFQRFPVNSTGTYSLSLKAQKRNGVYGNLAISLHQRKADKNFQVESLPNSAIWSDVCREIQISDLSKKLTVAVRDNGEDGRLTYGILLDAIEFKKGGCN